MSVFVDFVYGIILFREPEMRMEYLYLFASFPHPNLIVHCGSFLSIVSIVSLMDGTGFTSVRSAIKRKS